MIHNFRHSGLEALFLFDSKKGINPAFYNRLKRILFNINTAEVIADMNVPGYNLHPLHGNYAGFWSVNVSANYRVIFRFEDGFAHDVDLIDYH